MNLKKITNNGFFELATLGMIILSIHFFTAPLAESYKVIAFVLLVFSFFMTLLLPKRDLRLWLFIGWFLLLVYIVVMGIIFLFVLLAFRYGL